MKLIQSARLEHRQVQSPQMIQSMQILHLAALELQARIQEELVENPFLEIAEPGDMIEENAIKLGDTDGSTMLPEDAMPVQVEIDRRDVDSVFDELDRQERREREFDRGSRTRPNGEDGDKKLEAMANTPDVEKTLAEVLMDELAILDLDARRRPLAEYLLYSLDERGYLTTPLEDMARDCMSVEEPGQGPLLGPDEPPVTGEELQSILAEIRGISHPALGARDLRDCLLLQIEAFGLGSEPLLVAIVTNHLEDVRQNRIPRIARCTSSTMEDVKSALEMLKHCTPIPGAGFGESRADVILPDVVVEETDGKYEVRVDRARTPELRLSSAYRDFLRQARKDEGVREWVKKRLEAARWFLDAVAQRQSTLERISKAIFARQESFLDHGVPGLKPMRMQEIADEVHVHISTVSRAVSGKYAQTPRGIFALKFFFTGGTASENGEVASQTTIKQMIAEFAASEDPAKPFSDEELALMLEQRGQLKLARRTVTKYRKALAIPSSIRRRQF